MPSVFRRQSLLRRFLPRGCSTILLSRCSAGKNVNIILSSTSPWYQLNSDHRQIYTYGIVFVELNSIALPISITGIQVVRDVDSFNLVSGSLALDIADGIITGDTRHSNCWEFDITPRDVHDFLTSNSFLATFFDSLEKVLPDWLKFSHDGNVVLGVHDLQTDLVKGIDVQKGECRGAPLFDDHLYTVLKFGNRFSLSLYGQDVSFPEPAKNRKFCIVVDICQDLGGSIFLILPEGSGDAMKKFDMLKNMTDRFGIQLHPSGIGISLAKHINVHRQSTNVQLWNGDNLFNYP